MKNYTPIVPDFRLVEIIRGYISQHSTETTRPDLNNEHRLLELARLITDECQARLPLWVLEKGHGTKKIDVETLYALYEQASRQRDELMDVQRSMVEALRGRIQ
jgi:hypothetical protein